MINRIPRLAHTLAVLASLHEWPVLLMLKTWLICVLLAGLSACTPLGVLNAITPQSVDTHTIEGLSYGEHPRQQMDIYMPSTPSVSPPVVLFFYGGEWISGSRSDYAFVGRSLSARGIVTVVADYRLYPEVRYPHFLEDSASALAWTYREIKRYGGNPDQIFVMGHSAGAYNAAMLALDDRWLAKQGLVREVIKGWIGLAGPYNFLPVTNPNVQPVFFHPHTPPSSQPIEHVKQGSPPALLMAPGEDEVVNPARNTGKLAARLRHHKVPVTAFYFNTVGHATLVATLSPILSSLAPTLDFIACFVLVDSDNCPPSLATTEAGSNGEEQ